MDRSDAAGEVKEAYIVESSGRDHSCEIILVGKLTDALYQI